MTSSATPTFNVESLLADPAALPADLDAQTTDAIAADALSALGASPTPERWAAVGDLLGALAQRHATDSVLAIAQTWSPLRPDGGRAGKMAAAGLLPMLKDRGLLYAPRDTSPASTPASPAPLTITDPEAIEEIDRLVTSIEMDLAADEADTGSQDLRIFARTLTARLRAALDARND